MFTQDDKILNWVLPYIKKTYMMFSSPFGGDTSSYTFFDVGSNVGDYVKLVKTQFPNACIHCFEPNVYEQLIKNIADYNNVITNKLALSKETGKKTFVYPDKATALGSLVDRPIFYTWTDSKIVKLDVEVTTVDEYVRKNNIKEIDFMKVDVEGYELNVLLGAKNTLEQKKVKCGTFEYGDTFKDNNVTLKDLVEYLNSVGYKVFEGEIRKENELKPETLIEDYRWENFIYINEKLLGR